MDLASLYQQILALSRQMLTAGMAQMWDELVALEKQRQELIQQTTGYKLTPGIAPLIEEIQQCDSQLREKVEAWMTHTRILLREKQP